jgi:hypothetical protein
MESDRPQHYRPATCVTAQQHSFVTFISLHSQSHKKNSMLFKNEVQLHTSEIVHLETA